MTISAMNTRREKMPMPKIGVQAMMLKDSFAELGAFETLRKIRSIGYRAVEISQIPMSEENVAELARARDELGVEVAALSASLTAPKGSPMESLEHDFDKIVRDCQLLGASMLRIGIMPFDVMTSIERIRTFADATNEAAARLADHGIGLYYHNHHIEFTKHDGRFLLDVIADRAPLVGLEIDVHWVQRGGLNPVAVLSRYSDRVAMVHLKDYRIAPVSQDTVDALQRQDYAAFHQGFRHDVVQFAEVGEGNLDFTAIIDASIRVGARYLLVEQDDLYGRTAFECLQTSRDHLVELGYADLF